MSLVKNQAVAKAMFIYGCLSTALALYIYSSFAILQRPDVLDFLASHGSPGIWICITGAHLMTFVLTLLRSPMHERDPMWKPVIRPSKRSVLIGRVVVFVATCNVLYWIPYLYVTRDLRAFGWAVAAMFLLSTTYTMVHWALRPENVLSWSVLRFLRGSSVNPLMRPIVERAIARRPAMPLGEWLSELLRCCELAVSSDRLVNSETPGEGEIDSLEFQSLVLDELGSRTCLIRYKKCLSRGGFRAIQDFLHRVASLDIEEPNQATWQEAVSRARTVLAMRGTLVKPDQARSGPRVTGRKLC